VACTENAFLEKQQNRRNENKMIEPTDVRDLEQEGVLGVAWSSGSYDAFGKVKCDLRAQASGIKFRSIESQLEQMNGRLEKLEEVVTSLLKQKQQTQGEK
jgi:TolA-binding protein